MAKFSGKVGFVRPEETAPGVWVDKPYEKSYRGDIVRNYYRWQETQQLNSDPVMSNTISIVADAFAFDHLAYIKYVYWMGSAWSVTGIEPQRPRLNLTLGGVYNGDVLSMSCCCEEETCSTSGSFGEDSWIDSCVLPTS